VVAQEDDHFINGRGEAHKDGARDDRVADVESVKMGNVLDVFADVGVMEAVPGVDLKAAIMGVGGGAGVAGELLAAGLEGDGIGISAGVELDYLSAEVMRAIDLRGIGVDEGTDLDFRGLEFRDDDLELGGIRAEIEAALRGDFLAIFGHEANFLRLEAKRLADHRGRGGHLEIERDAKVAGEIADIGLLDVAAVLAEMDGDAIGAGFFGDLRGLEDGGFRREALFPIAIARFAQSGDMIYIQAEAKHGRRLSQKWARVTPKARGAVQCRRLRGRFQLRLRIWRNRADFGRIPG
jgi:hypothetical protein